MWYAYTTRSDYLQTTEFININFDLTDKLNVEAGTVHFHSDSKYYSPYGQFSYAPTTPALSVSSSHKWNSRFGINYKFTDKMLGYALFSQGFRDGGSNSGYPQSCYDNGVPQQLHAGHPEQLRARLEDHEPQRPPDLERRDLRHGVEAVPDHHLRPDHVRRRAATT